MIFLKLGLVLTTIISTLDDGYKARKISYRVAPGINYYQCLNYSIRLHESHDLDHSFPNEKKHHYCHATMTLIIINNDKTTKIFQWGYCKSRILPPIMYLKLNV